MGLDNFRLIDEVRQRRALWDSTMQFGTRKNIGAAQWAEVAKEMEEDVTVCKKRFKGLRDSYRSEIRKIQQRRTETSNWPYFRALEFLRDIFDPDKLVAFSPVPYNVHTESPELETSNLDDFVIDVDNDDSFDFEIMGDIFKRDPSDSRGRDSGSDMSTIKPQNFDSSNISNSSAHMNRSDVESSPRLLSPLKPKPPVAKRAKRRKTSSSTDGDHHGKCKKPAPQESTAKDDPDYNFLISLLPHVKTLSSLNNMKFRTEVSRMLMEMNQQDMQSVRRERENTAVLSLPKIIPAHPHEPAVTKYSTGGSLNGASPMAHSSMIECDVKIENELLY